MSKIRLRKNHTLKLDGFSVAFIKSRKHWVDLSVQGDGDLALINTGTGGRVLETQAGSTQTVDVLPGLFFPEFILTTVHA